MFDCALIGMRLPSFVLLRRTLSSRGVIAYAMFVTCNMCLSFWCLQCVLRYYIHADLLWYSDLFYCNLPWAHDHQRAGLLLVRLVLERRHVCPLVVRPATINAIEDSIEDSTDSN